MLIFVICDRIHIFIFATICVHIHFVCDQIYFSFSLNIFSDHEYFFPRSVHFFFQVKNANHFDRRLFSLLIWTVTNLLFSCFWYSYCDGQMMHHSTTSNFYTYVTIYLMGQKIDVFVSSLFECICIQKYACKISGRNSKSCGSHEFFCHVMFDLRILTRRLVTRFSRNHVFQTGVHDN